MSKLRKFPRATVSKLLVIKIRSATCKPRKVYAEVKSQAELDKTLRVLEKNKGQYYIRFLRGSPSSCRGIHLSLGNRISVFHLARRNRVDDRNVPFALIMIIPNVAAFGPGVTRAERERITLRAPGSCLVKFLDRGKMRSQDRPTLPFCLCHAYLPSTTATGIAKIHKG